MKLPELIYILQQHQTSDNFDDDITSLKLEGEVLVCHFNDTRHNFVIMEDIEFTDDEDNN